MLSKNELKQIKQLASKKYRSKTGLFVAEGIKVVREFCDSGWKTQAVYSVNELDFVSFTKVDKATLDKITNFSTASSILAIFKLPGQKEYSSDEFSVALDSISDPGNLGTIIRLCDWFGIKNIICSNETVDCFNPKVVQSTMGSIARVNCYYCDLEAFLSNQTTPIYGACLEGTPYYTQDFDAKGLLVMGSESHGISPKIEKLLNKKITIPPASDRAHPESLNVAMATAIILGEIYRS